MKIANVFRNKDFRGIPDDPVILKPFNSKTSQIANLYKFKLDRLLSSFGLKAHIKGSTALEIEGKGEVDLRIFVPTNRWLFLLKYFINYYRRIETLEEEYVRFVDFYQDTEIEIGLVRGKRARMEVHLSTYLRNNSAVLEEYVKLKRKYAYSRREYTRQKDKFFRSIIKKL